MAKPRILVLGVGNILFRDEGVGVRVAETLDQYYEFPENVTVMDGGTLGLNLLGTISETDHLIVVDCVRNGGESGDLYRISGDAIPERVRAKNSLHQVDLLESLTLCQALGPPPETVILGVEPLDMETMGLDLTELVNSKIPDLMEMVFKELNRLEAGDITKRSEPHVPGCTSQTYRHE